MSSFEEYLLYVGLALLGIGAIHIMVWYEYKHPEKFH